MKAWVKFTVTSIFVALVAIGVALLSRMLNRVLNSCGTGRFEDDACVCVEPYTGAHCEIINCGYGSIVTSVWLVDTITTKDNEDSVTGCACDNQFWGVNCEQCSSYNKDECTGPCDVDFYGPRCEVLCMASSTGKDARLENHEDAKGEANWFVPGQGLCKRDGQVACKRDTDDLYFTGDHCELKCPNCVNGGICRYDEGGAFCECPAGFAGALCESECPLRCSGLNGVCNIVDGEAVCDCNLGRTGSGCELTCCVRGARTSRGIKNGDCPTTGGCDCDPGFFGPDCDCSAATCNNNGACNNVTGACECDERFSGLKCEYCSDQYVGPLCTIVRQNCTFHGEFTIINKHGDYGCLCDPGFAGEECEQCMENAYPKPTGSNAQYMCTNIVPDSMCHNGRVVSDYDTIRRPDMTMCNCDGHFSTKTDCATCMENWYGPECDVYCAEPCVTSGGVCLQSGPGCTCAGSLSVDVETQTCVLCAAGECQNGGICYNGVCQCDPGFFGDLCEVSAPMHEGKVCNGEYGSSVLTTFDAPCQSKDDCLDTSHPNILNKKMALQVERYKWEDSMICYRTDTPQALRTVSGCCVDSDADGRCDKANLTIPRSQCEDVPYMGEYVQDICDNRVLEGEVNVFEWCLSKQRGCTKNGECADPILCGDYVPGVNSSEWEKRWVSDHTSVMSSLMSEVWRFPVDGIEDPFAFREHYNDTDLEEVCTQPEVYTQCRNLLIPDVDTFTFNPKQKRLFRDGWQPMPEFGNGCGVVWSKVYNLGNATNFTVPIGPVHVDRIHVEGIAAVYAVDVSGDLVPGNPGKVISGLEVLGKGDVKIVLYDYKDDECERLQIRAASMFEVCETLTIVELDYDWGPFCKWWVTYNHIGGFEERKYQQSLVCAGCEDYQEGCEGLPLEDQPMPDPCDVGLSAWLDFCDVYMSDNKVDGTCGRISCECEEGPLGIGGDACQYNCPIPLGFTTPCGEGEDPPLGRCVGTVTTALNLGTSQGVCECFNPVANPLEGCIVNCDEDSFTCSKDVDTPFTFRSQGCNYEHVQSVTILPGALASTTQGLKNFTGVSYGECNTTFESFGEACFTDGVDVFLGNHVAEDMECNVLLPDSVCNALYGRCECATPYSVLSPEGMVYFNPDGNYRAALMQGYDINQYIPFMTYSPPIQSPMTLERANTYCPKDNEFRFPGATCIECMGAHVCLDTSTNTDLFGDTCASYVDGKNCGDFDRYDVNPFRIVSSGTCESNGFLSLNIQQCSAYDSEMGTYSGTVTEGCVKDGDDVIFHTFKDYVTYHYETLPVCEAGLNDKMYVYEGNACAGTLDTVGGTFPDLSNDELLDKCYYTCEIYADGTVGFGVIEEGTEKGKCFCIPSFTEGCTPAQESLFGGLVAYRNNYLLYAGAGSCETAGYSTITDEQVCTMINDKLTDLGLYRNPDFDKAQYHIDGCNTHGFIKDKIPRLSTSKGCMLCICANMPRTNCKVRVNSKSCEYHGYNPVISVNECSKLTALPAIDTSSPDIPYGCSVVNGVAYVGSNKGKECTDCFCDACGQLRFPFQLINGSCTDNLLYDIGTEEECTDALEFFGLGTATLGTGTPGCNMDNMGIVPGTGTPLMADMCDYYVSSPSECLDAAKYLGFPELIKAGKGTYIGESFPFTGTMEECRQKCNENILMEIPIRSYDSGGYEYKAGVSDIVLCPDGTIATVSGWVADTNMRVWDDGSLTHAVDIASYVSRSSPDRVRCTADNTIVFGQSYRKNFFVWKDGALTKLNTAISGSAQDFDVKGTNMYITAGTNIYVYDLTGTMTETFEISRPLCNSEYTCGDFNIESECSFGTGLNQDQLAFVQDCCIWEISGRNYECRTSSLSADKIIATSDGKLVVSLPKDVAFINPDRTIRSIRKAFTEEVSEIALSPDESKVVAGGRFGETKLIMWSTEGEKLAESFYLSVGTAGIADVTFISNDKIAAASLDKIYIYNDNLQLLRNIDSIHVQSVVYGAGVLWAGSTNNQDIGLRKLKIDPCVGISRNGDNCDIFLEITGTTGGENDLYEQLDTVEVSEGPRCFYTDTLYYNPTPTTSNQQQICFIQQRSLVPGLNRLCRVKPPLDFVLVDSNTCEHFGYVTVKTSAHCQEAASQLDFNHAVDFSTNSYPEGCIRDVNENLRLNTHQSAAQCDASAKCACYKRSVTMFYTQTQACPTPVETQSDCVRAVYKLFSEQISIVSDPDLPHGCSGLDGFVWNTVGGACSDRTCVCAVKEAVVSPSRDIASQRIEQYDIPEVNKFVQTRIETPVRMSKWLGYGSCSPTEDLPFHERTNPYVFDLSERECEAKCMNTDGCNSYSFTAYTHEGKGTFSGTHTEHDAESIEECAGMCMQQSEIEYHVVTSGTCAANGYTEIRSQDECEAVAIAYGYASDIVSIHGRLHWAGSYSDPMPGCWLNDDDEARYNTNDESLGPATTTLPGFNTEIRAICKHVCAGFTYFGWHDQKKCRLFPSLSGTPTGDEEYVNSYRMQNQCVLNFHGCDERIFLGDGICASGSEEAMTLDECEEQCMRTIKPEYYQITSGTCASNGYSIIDSVTDCRSVVDVLQLDFDGNENIAIQSGGLPTGCVYHPNNDYVRLNSKDGVSCSSTWNCICKKDPCTSFSYSGGSCKMGSWCHTGGNLGTEFTSSTSSKRYMLASRAHKYYLSTKGDCQRLVNTAEECEAAGLALGLNYESTPEYVKITSGTCESNGYEKVSTIHECDQAALDLNMISPSPTPGYNAINNRGPYGATFSSCHSIGDLYLYWNTNEGTGGCETRTCICKKNIGCVYDGTVKLVTSPACTSAECVCAPADIPGNRYAVSGARRPITTPWMGIPIYSSQKYTYSKFADQKCTDSEAVITYTNNNPGTDTESFADACFESCIAGSEDAGSTYTWDNLESDTDVAGFVGITGFMVETVPPPTPVTTYTPTILENNKFCNNQVSMNYVAQNTADDCAAYCGALGYTGFFLNHAYPSTKCKCATDGCVSRGLYVNIGDGYCLPDSDKRYGMTLEGCKNICTSLAGCNAFSHIGPGYDQCIFVTNGCDGSGEWGSNSYPWSRYAKVTADAYKIDVTTEIPGAVAIYTPVILETNTYCTVQATMSYVAQNTPEECAEYCGAEGYTGFFMDHNYPNTMCKCATDGCSSRHDSEYPADAYEIQVTNGESKTVTTHTKIEQTSCVSPYHTDAVFYPYISLQACKNLCKTTTHYGQPCKVFLFARQEDPRCNGDMCYCVTCHSSQEIDGDPDSISSYDRYEPQTSEITLVEPPPNGKCYCTYAIPGGTCDGSSDFKHYVIQAIDETSTGLPAPEPAKVGLRQLETYEKYGFSVSERTCTTPINPTTYPYDGLEDCLQMCLHTDLCEFVEVNGNCKLMQGCSAFSYTGTLYEYDHFERMKECPFPPCDDGVGWDDMYVKVPGKTVTSSSVTDVAASNFEQCRNWCSANECAAFVYGTSYCRAYSTMVETSDSEYDLYIKIEPTKYDYGYKMVSATACISTSPSYIEINSGTCESNGYIKVRSAQECDEAALYLNMISPSPTPGYNAINNRGAYGATFSSCHSIGDLYLYWNTDEGTGGCETRTCICKTVLTNNDLLSAYHEDEIPGETFQDKTENCFRACVGGKKYDTSSQHLLTKTDYFRITSGTCVSNGYTEIRSIQECDEAAVKLNIESSYPITGFNVISGNGNYGTRSKCTITISSSGTTSLYWNYDEGGGNCPENSNCICASITYWDSYVVNGFRVSNDGENCECHTHVPESSSECTETGTTFKTFKITPYVFKDYTYEKVADSICIPGTMGTRVVAYSGNIPGNTFEQKKDTCFQACLSGSEHVSTFRGWSWSTLNAAINGFHIKKDGTSCMCISGVPETDSGCTDTDASYEMYRITPTPSGDTKYFEEKVIFNNMDYTVTTTTPNLGFVQDLTNSFLYPFPEIGICRTVEDSPYYIGSGCPSLSAQDCAEARLAFPEASGDCASVTPKSLVEFTGAVGTSEYIIDGYACTGSVTIKKYFSGHPLKIVEGAMTWQEAMDAPAVVSIPNIDTKTFTASAGLYTYICESHSQMIGRILVSDCTRVCKREPGACGETGDCVCLLPPNEDMCDGGAPLDTALCTASGGTRENGMCMSSGSKLCVRGEKLFDAKTECCGCGGGEKGGLAKTAYHYVKDGVSECVCSEDEQCDKDNEDWDHYGFINMNLPYEYVGKGACTDMQMVKVEGNTIPERMGYCAAACSARNIEGFGMNAMLCVCTNHCDNDYPLDRFGFKETFEVRYYKDESVIVEAWDAQSRHLRCFKDLNKTEEVLCSHIRALHHFARGTSYRVGDCTYEAPGTENQIPCNGRGFVVSGTCYCDYAETLDIGSQGFGVTYEPPTLLQTPYRGKSCGHFCPGYNMRDMESVCSGHGVCQSTGNCDCDQSFAGYKCHVQCELEPGPLTCSGHGTCEEQDVPFEIDDTYEIADTIYSWKVCPEESGYLAQDKVLRIGDDVHYVFNEMSEMRYERYTVSIGNFFSLYSRGHRCDIPGYTLDRLVFANSPEFFEQVCEESCQAYKGFNTNFNDRKCECIMQVAPSECNTWTNSNGDIIGTLLEDEGWNLYEKREGDVLELQESREASMDDYYIYGPLYRMPYGSEEPHMPCYDSVLSTREKLTAPLIEISSNIVKLPCAVLPNYRVVCGACKCFEHDTLGHFTGYNCRTPAMGYYGVRGTKKCRGMNQDNEPCNGHGTCNWGSLLGLGQQVETQTQCFCGSVEDDVTFESAPRNNDGEIMIHVDNLGEPLYVRTLKYANVDCSTDGFQEVTTAESCREASAYMGSVWNTDVLYTFDGGCARIGSNMYLSTSEQFDTEEVIDSCVEALPEVTKTYTDVFSEGMLRITDPQECMVAVKNVYVNALNYVKSLNGRKCIVGTNGITQSSHNGQGSLERCAEVCSHTDGFIWKSPSSGCYCTTGTIDGCESQVNTWEQYKIIPGEIPSNLKLQRVQLDEYAPGCLEVDGVFMLNTGNGVSCGSRCFYKNNILNKRQRIIGESSNILTVEYDNNCKFDSDEFVSLDKGYYAEAEFEIFSTLDAAQKNARLSHFCEDNTVSKDVDTNEACFEFCLGMSGPDNSGVVPQDVTHYMFDGNTCTCSMSDLDSCTNRIDVVHRYVMVNSGTCASNGYEKVSTIHECDQAAIDLDIISPSPFTGYNALHWGAGYGSTVSSCAIHNIGRVKWNANEGTGGCETKTCICKEYITFSMTTRVQEDSIMGCYDPADANRGPMIDYAQYPLRKDRIRACFEACVALDNPKVTSFRYWDGQYTGGYDGYCSCYSGDILNCDPNKGMRSYVDDDYLNPCPSTHPDLQDNGGLYACYSGSSKCIMYNTGERPPYGSEWDTDGVDCVQDSNVVFTMSYGPFERFCQTKIDKGVQSKQECAALCDADSFNRILWGVSTCKCISGCSGGTISYDASEFSIVFANPYYINSDKLFYVIKDIRYYTSPNQYISGTSINLDDKIYEPLTGKLVQTAEPNPSKVCVNTEAYGKDKGVLNEHPTIDAGDIQECAAYCINDGGNYAYFETLTFEATNVYDSSCNFGLGCMRNQEARVENRCWCAEYNDRVSCESAGLSWLDPRDDYSNIIDSGLNPPGRGVRPLGVKGTTYVGPGYCSYNLGTQDGRLQEYDDKTLGECAQLCYDDVQCVVFAYLYDTPFFTTTKCVTADATCDRGGKNVEFGGIDFKMYTRFKMSRSSYVTSNMERPSVSLFGSIAELPDRLKIKDVVCYANDVCPPE